ncbi:MAG: mismatch-specific DNA-glycosylase [Nitrospinota bacterium]
MIDDLIKPNLLILFCGTALGEASFKQQAYYAHPGNKFYRALYETRLTDKLVKPENYRLLLSYNIGLTDLNKKEYGSDSSLSKEHFDKQALRQKILYYQPSVLAFTSKRAASEFLGRRTISYGEVDTTIGDTRLFTLPSPSGLAVRYWDITYWHQLAKLVR